MEGETKMKKRLLNEETTRRFMKLANLGGLSENFVTETEAELEEAYMEEEDPEMGLEDEEPEMGLDPEMGAEEPEMDLDADLPPEEPEMDMGAEAPASGDLDASAVINAVAQATLDALKGQGLVSDETTVAVDDEDGMGDDLGVEDEMPMPEPEMDVEEPAMEMGDEAPLEDEEEMMEQTDSIEEDGALVNEIVRRVARRILAAKKNKS